MITVNLDAQALYSQGIIKGKNVNYYCKELIRTVIVRNIQNRDTLTDMYFDDEKTVPISWMLESGYNFKIGDIVQAFREVFTSQELKQLKNTRGSFIINVVADKAGNSLEMDFTFQKNNSVSSKFTLDRLFLLETKLKKILKIKIRGEDVKIKNLKYMVVVSLDKDLN